MTSSMLRRQLKNLVQNFSEAEVKVREATSNDPWGPSSSQMADISDLTYNVVACNEIMTMLWKRLKDDKNWRHVHKSLTLLEYLLKTGDDRVLNKLKDNTYIVKALTEFRFADKDGKDQGVNVREKAKVVLVLMEDEEKLKEERDFAMKTREKTSKNAAASSSDTVKDPSYKPVYVPGATGLPSLDNIPSVADLAASFAAKKEEQRRAEAEKREAERRAKLSEEELQWEDAAKAEPKEKVAPGAWGGAAPEEEGSPEKPDPWGGTQEPKEDPWGGAPAKPSAATAGSDPWGAPTTPPKDTDPFAAPKNGQDPFAAPKSTPDPFAAPKKGADPFSAPTEDPFNAPKDDPFAAPPSALKNGEDPFAAPKDKRDPFSAPKEDPFNAPKDPFDAPKDPFNSAKDPFDAPKEDPFSAPKDPFNAPKEDPFSAPKDPFNSPKDDPFTTPKEDPFNSPKDPFNAPKEDPFSQPQKDPFNAPKEDPFSQPQKDPFESPKETPDPFSAPSDPPKESGADPFGALPSPPAAGSPDPFDDAAAAASVPPASEDAWGAPATSPPPPGDDAWGPPTETKAAAAAAIADDPFGDGSKAEEDPWETPVGPPATSDDAWGAPVAPSDSDPSSDPWGDGGSTATKKTAGSDPWGAPSNGTDFRTTRGDKDTKLDSFLGAGSALVDMDSLLTFPKVKQNPFNTSPPQKHSVGLMDRTMSNKGVSPATRSPPPSSYLGSIPALSYGLTQPHFGLSHSSQGGTRSQMSAPSLGQPQTTLSSTATIGSWISPPNSGAGMVRPSGTTPPIPPQVASPYVGSCMGKAISTWGVLPPYSVAGSSPFNPLAGSSPFQPPPFSGVGKVQAEFVAGTPQPDVSHLEGFITEEGGSSTWPHMLPTPALGQTTPKNNNPFLL